MPAKVRIEFISDGFVGVLNDPGTVSLLNSVAAKKRAECEARYQRKYRTRQTTAWDGRPRVIVSMAPGQLAAGERVPHLTHEQWMSEVWPKVGGASWRPKR